MKYLGNWGDACPFDYHGFFVFENDDGSLEGIRFDNIFDSVGERDAREMEGKVTEESNWVHLHYANKDDLFKHKDEILSTSDIPEHDIPYKEDEMLQMLFRDAAYSGHPAAGYGPNEHVFHSYLECARYVLDYAGDAATQELKDELYNEMDPPWPNDINNAFERAHRAISDIADAVAHYEGTHPSLIKNLGFNGDAITYRVNNTNQELERDELLNHLDKWYE